MFRTAYSALIVSVLSSAAIVSAAEPFVLQGEQLKPRQPQMAVGPDNAVHLVFGSGSRIYHCLSLDAGQTFSDPTVVGEVRFLSLGMRRGPRLAVTKDTIVVTAIGGELGGGRDGDLYAWRSIDGGKTWQVPARVNDVDASAREGLHGMAAGPVGELHCVWLDLRNKRTELTGSRSDDGGRTWSENHLIYKSPDGSICECCHPSIAVGQDGTVYAMWRNSLDGNRDMYVAKSNDGGRTYRDATKLGGGSWRLGACPMDGGAIAVDRTGEVFAAWRRETSVYVSDDEAQREEKLGNGEQPWIALLKGGPAVAWINRRPGDLMLRVPDRAQPLKLASGARDPHLVAHDDQVTIAWETEINGRNVIKVIRVDVSVRQPE